MKKITIERDKQAVKAATDFIISSLEQAGGYPQRNLGHELELQHRRDIERAKKREVEHIAAFEAATWYCAFCQAVHTPKILDFPEQGRVVFVPVEFCDCAEAQVERDRAARAEREQKQARHVAYLETLDLWRDFDTEWPENQAAKEQLGHAKQKVFEWYVGRSSAGLMLAGGYGCGKSHLLRAVKNAYGLQGANVVFYTEPEL